MRKKDYRTPVLASLQAVGLNIGLNILFVFGFHFGPASICWAMSLASIFSFLFLSYRLSKQMGSLFSQGMIRAFWKITACGLLAFIAAWIVGLSVFHDPTFTLWLGNAPLPIARDFFSQILLFGGESLAFFSALFLSAYLLKVPEILQLVRLRRGEA